MIGISEWALILSEAIKGLIASIDLEIGEIREWVSAVFAGLGVVIALRALRLAETQLVPLRKEIKNIAAERNRNRRIRENRKPPRRNRTVVGFDPRFTNSEWNALIADENSNITMKLTNRYEDFYKWFQVPLPKTNILIVDLLKVPNYLENNYIASLSNVKRLDFDGLMRLRSNAYGRPIDPPLINLMRLMSSNEAGDIGAIPIWINSHGRMIPDPQLFAESGGRLATVTSLDQLRMHGDAKKVFAEAGIQSFHITFEFWAHLAYRGCCLFKPMNTATSNNKGRPFTSNLLSSYRELEAFAEAVADIATRLRYSNLTKDVFQKANDIEGFLKKSAFELGHRGDARMIRESLALWKPVFSSELLTRAMPRRADEEISAKLLDETSFKLPFVRRLENGSWSYLSALGGYGLALPKDAQNDKHSLRAIKYLFLTNPVLMHSYINTMLQDDLNELSSIDDFFHRYGRPRWPFWSDVEKELTIALFGIFLCIDRSKDSSCIHPNEFWISTRELVITGSGKGFLHIFLERVKNIAEKNQWTFNYNTA